MINVSKWMSWNGGIDLTAITNASAQMPNLIIHLASMVHTPVGSATSGMILWQPDPAAQPAVMGFVSTDENVGKYFGPNIFADTPFEHAPVLTAPIKIDVQKDSATANCTVSGYIFELELGAFSAPYLIDRKPSAMPPFYQQGVEIEVGMVSLKINGEKIKLTLPPTGIAGGPACVVSPNGVYAR